MGKKEEKKPSPEGAGPSRLTAVKDIAGIIQSVLICLSIITAGIWFFLQRDPLPKANITHEITHRQITPELTWLHVSVSITNVGKRLLQLESGFTRLQKILPLDPAIADTIKAGKSPVSPVDCVVPWRTSHSFDLNLTVAIEPGETDILNYEFIIPAYIRTVKIYSYFERRKDLGWSRTTIYDLTKSGG